MYFSLARSKACGFMRGKPGPRGPGVSKGLEKEDEEDTPPVLGPWFLHRQAALARVGVEEPALALTEWEGRQVVEGSFGFLSLAAALHPGEQNIQL